MNPEPVVLTSSLSKDFRHVRALDDLNLRIESGEVVALIGANGSGKSTTFRLLLNIYEPSFGTASVLDRDSTSLNGSDFEGISYISEGQKLPLWMEVRQYIDHCSAFYENWDSDFCDRLFESFQLPERGKLKHLSRGQLMKAALVSSLPSRPKLLLLDEPFSGLDVETRAQLGHLLKSLSSEHGLTTIITTHDVEEIEPIATRLAMLRKGKLVLDEGLGVYLGRHRTLVLDGFEVGDLPDEVKSAFKEVTFEGSEWFTERFDDELEALVHQSVPEGVGVTFVPMPLRQVLTFHSLPVL